MRDLGSQKQYDRSPQGLNLILKINEVWEQKYKAFQILAAQKHLWAYYERVALNRGIQGSRNTGVPMTYGEAYQRLFPTVELELK